jgi:hypothetical protein
MGSDVMKRGVHDVVTEKFTREIGDRYVEFDVGEQFYDLCHW